MRSELTRGVGPWAAMAVNVANMIGTGVFLKTRVMTCNVGSAKTVRVVWPAAGLLSLAGTFSYSEIAAMMPEAGGDYVYLRRAYGRLVGFLYGWMAFTVARAGSQAALAVGLAIFMNVALGGALDRWHVAAGAQNFHLSGLTLVALAAIWTVALINCASVAAGGRMALLLTIAKVGLVLSVGIGAFVFASGDWGHLAQSGLAGTCEGVASSARGGVAGFGAAMLGALWARDGLFFRRVTRLSPPTNVPVRAILAQAAWASVLALSGSYDTLTDSVIFASWLFYGLVTASLFVFRKRMPDAPRPYRAWGYPGVPLIFLFVTAALLINTFVASPREALCGVALLGAGLPFYWYWARRSRLQADR